MTKAFNFAVNKYGDQVKIVKLTLICHFVISSSFHFVIVSSCHFNLSLKGIVDTVTKAFNFAVNKYGDEVKILIELTLVCHFVSLSSNHSGTSIAFYYGETKAE